MRTLTERGGGGGRNGLSSINLVRREGKARQEKGGSLPLVVADNAASTLSERGFSLVHQNGTIEL
jgi:hypothetical protein